MGSSYHGCVCSLLEFQLRPCFDGSHTAWEQVNCAVPMLSRLRSPVRLAPGWAFGLMYHLSNVPAAICLLLCAVSGVPARQLGGSETAECTTSLPSIHQSQTSLASARADARVEIGCRPHRAHRAHVDFRICGRRRMMGLPQWRSPRV